MTAVATRTWRQVAGRVARHLDYGAGHRWLELAVPGDFASPAPGQFVQILLPPTASAALLARPMSIAGVRRARGALLLGFLYAPVGTGTRSLAALAQGAEVEVLGPLGRGYPLETPGTPLLVAGGRGVAPLLFAADALARGGRRSEFLFGARDRAHLVGLADARRRLDSLGSRLHLCTDDGSRGWKGHVVGLLDRVARTLEGPLAIFACGPHGMLKSVAAWGDRRGASTWLAMESVMACGTGVCRGCPLPRSAQATAGFARHPTPSLYGNAEWAMCCTEGPVFEAGDLDWARVT
jgi:dihydroorotate dehydrogenase electron transfer subunit